MIDVRGDVSPAGVRVLQRLIDSAILGSAWYAGQTESTNTQALVELRERELPSSALPRLYLTDQQTAGRGRRGRQWISNLRNLAFSFVIETQALPADRDGLASIAVGVAVAQTIEHEFAPVKTWLKWPNDVWIDGGKIAGILLEKTSSQPHHLVIGVGINIADAPVLTADDREPDESVDRQSLVEAKSIAETTGRHADRFDVLETLIPRLTETLTSIFAADSQSASSGNAELIADFRARCLLTGKQIQFLHRGENTSGLCSGVDQSGALLVERQGKTMRVQSGDVSLVRF